MRYVPVALSSLLLGAHFLRDGNIALVAIAIALPFLLLVRKPWAVRVVQVALLGGSLMWITTAIRIGEARQAIGAPSARMFAILGAVAAFTAFAALPLDRLFQNCENANV